MIPRSSSRWRIGTQTTERTRSSATLREPRKRASTPASFEMRRASVGVQEAQHRLEHLLQEWYQLALDADGASELESGAQLLVVPAELGDVPDLALARKVLLGDGEG